MKVTFLHDRSLLREGDRSQFDATVHQRFDDMEVERSQGKSCWVNTHQHIYTFRIIIPRENEGI